MLPVYTLVRIAEAARGAIICAYVDPERLDDLGKLALRLALGILVLLHGMAIGDWIEPLQNVIASRGLPRWFVYGVYLGEVAGPLLLILGFYARLGAVMIAVNMIAAVALERSRGLFTLAAHGGWAVELEAIYLCAAVALVLLGPGRLSIDRR